MARSRYEDNYMYASVIAFACALVAIACVAPSMVVISGYLETRDFASFNCSLRSDAEVTILSLRGRSQARISALAHVDGELVATVLVYPPITDRDAYSLVSAFGFEVTREFVNELPIGASSVNFTCYFPEPPTAARVARGIRAHYTMVYMAGWIVLALLGYIAALVFVLCMLYMVCLAVYECFWPAPGAAHKKGVVIMHPHQLDSSTIV